MEAKETLRRIGLPIIKLPDGTYACPVCEVYVKAEAKSVGTHFVKHWAEIGVKHRPTGSDLVKCPHCTMRFKRHALSGHLRGVHKIEQATAVGLARTLDFDLDTYLAPTPQVEEWTPRKQTSTYVKIGDMTPEEQERTRQHWRDEAARKREDKAAGTVTDRRTPTYTAVVQCPIPACDYQGQRKNMPGHLQSGRHRIERLKANRMAREAVMVGEPRNLPARVEKESSTREEHHDLTVMIDPTDAALAVVQSQVNGHGVPTHLLPDVVHYVDATRELAAKLREV